MRALLLAMPNSAWAFHLYAVVPNLAINSIAGNVDDQFEVDIADLILIRRNFKKFLERRISKHAPDVVGLSAMSFQAKAARYIARFIKQLDPEVKVVFGGYHATLMPDEVGQLWGSNLDFIIRGEGEVTFNALLRALDAGLDDFHDIEGLSFRENGEYVHNPRRELLELSKLNPPNRAARLLKDGFHSFGIKTDVVETSRGCLANCKFCSINKMYGRSLRTFPIDCTLDDIESCKNAGAKAIFFVDDNINLDAEHFGSLCYGIVERGLTYIHYSTQVSVKGLYDNPILLKKMVEANFKGVFMGIENPDPKNLKLYGKNIKKMASKAEAVVSYLRSHKVLVAGGLIVGNPDDTEKDFYNVLNYAKQIEIDLAIFFLLQPYPATKIREILLERDLVFNKDDFSSYDGLTPNVRTAHLSENQIAMLREELWSGFYDADWFLRNNFLRLYPKYFLRLGFRYFPRFLKLALYELTRSKTKLEIVQERLQYEKDYRDLKN
ncbi:MAG: B12-binding domain-containing radical SAM protein [Candidatus Hodarchaeales archaeon]|jgi:radical SAM superfamily enzyme YgiQ (UPF0313 family)